MNCPKCAVALGSVKLPLHDGGKGEALEVDRCEECDGVWFDKDELERFEDAGLALPAAKPLMPDHIQQLDAQAAACPRCATSLAKRPSARNAGVTLDVCGKCGGAWVDGTELDRVGGSGSNFSDQLNAMFGDLKREE